MRCLAPKLTTRMMMFFAVVAVLPGAGLRAFRCSFSRRRSSYFDTRIDKRRAGLQLGRTALNQPLKDLVRKAETIADGLSARRPADARAALLLLREQTGVANAALLTTNGVRNDHVQATESVLALPPSRPRPGTAAGSRHAKVTAVEPAGDTGLQLRSSRRSPRATRHRSGAGHHQPVPAALREQTERVEAGFPRLSGTVLPAHCGSGCSHSR